MSIASLSLKGFKSFGNACSFDFNSGFTAIVGPNGSGKSNILDALRWILGEGGNSALRITKQSDLLFQGSKSVNPALEATVKLVLRGADKSNKNNKNYENEKNENEKYGENEKNNVLKRVYAAETGGTLYLNDKKILLQDLDALKPQFGLEGEGFAFIGQGEVSAAIHQRPRDRRRQLDLLFGIERYRDMRDDSIRRLDDALAEGERIRTLIHELETRRAEIADDVAIAVEAQGIIDNLDILRRDFYFSRRYELEKNEYALRSDMQVVKMRLELAERWQNLWRRAVNLGEGKMRLSGFDNAKIEDFKNKINNLASRRELLHRQAFQAAMRVKAIKDIKITLNQDNENFLNQQNALNTEFLNIKKQLDENLKLYDERKAELKAREDEIKKNRENLEREKKRRQALHNERAERELFKANTEAQINAIKISSQSGEAELNALIDNQAAHENKLSELEKNLKILDENYNELNLQYNANNSDLKLKNSEFQALRREISRREADIDLLKDNIESSAYPEPVRALLEASRKKLIKSSPVPVVEVFSFKDNNNNIATALEAYLGARQAWLLAKNFDEAQEGIEFLKSRRAGRVTYLPLDRCRPREPDYNFKLPLNGNKNGGYAAWVMDLIDVKSPWQPAIAHIMGDLLIVKDYALGSEIARRARFPVVTLEGEVFAPAGTVSGGNIRQRGSAVVIKAQIDRAELELNKSRKNLINLENYLKTLEKAESDLLIKLEKLNSERGDLKAETASEHRELNNIKNAVKRLNDENKSSSEKIKKLESELDLALKRIYELDNEIAEFKELEQLDFNNLEPEMILAPLRSSLDLADERLKSSREAEKRVSHELENLKLKIKNADKELDEINNEERLKRELLKNIGIERKKVYYEERDLKNQVETAQSSMRHERSRLERLNVRSGLADAAVLSRKSEISALDERLNNLSSERLQLTELWDEKYPYDKSEAREVEGGRELTSSLRKLERALKALGNYNLGALSEDVSLTERVDFLSDQLNDVENGADELKNLISGTDAQVEETFTNAMREIDAKFNALFQRLFAGGEARLTLQEGENIWERGVEIYARPPGKKLQNISQLSGGEQSLTAIAQLFAALEVAKVPLAVLDEVDAALDEYNLIRFADLAKEYSRTMQIIVMTHRRTTMERADLIYGVTMVEPGLSRIVGIDVENYL